MKIGQGSIGSGIDISPTRATFAYHALFTSTSMRPKRPTAVLIAAWAAELAPHIEGNGKNSITISLNEIGKRGDAPLQRPSRALGRSRGMNL